MLRNCLVSWYVCGTFQVKHTQHLLTPPINSATNERFPFARPSCAPLVGRSLFLVQHSTLFCQAFLVITKSNHKSGNGSINLSLSHSLNINFGSQDQDTQCFRLWTVHLFGEPTKYHVMFPSHFPRVVLEPFSRILVSVVKG